LKGHSIAEMDFSSRFDAVIASLQVNVRNWPVAAGFRFNSGFHFSIETDEPVGSHFQQQIPDTFFASTAQLRQTSAVLISR